MHDLTGSGMLDEGSDSEKHAGTNEKPALQNTGCFVAGLSDTKQATSQV
jgi:hypothetical protein